jgi:hypothetical protein
MINGAWVMRSSIRVLSLSVALLAPATALRAECRRDTLSHRPPQMAFFSQFAAFHFDFSNGQAQFNGKNTGLGQGRLAVAWCGLPALTIVYTGSAYVLRQTAFVSRDSAGFHPQLFANLNGFELQVRWPDARRVHFIGSASTGAAETQYEFWRLNPNATDYTNVAEHVVEGRSSTRYVDASIGVELTVWRFVRLYSLVGARRSGSTSTPEVSALPFNGPFATVTLGLGKFR